MKLSDYTINGKLMRQVPLEGAPGAAPVTPPTESPPAAEAPVDLSFVPAEFLKDGKPDLGAFAEHYRTVTAPKELPETYDFALPADMTFDDLPEEHRPAIDLTNPLFTDLSATLKEMGAPADAGTKLTGLLAKYQAEQVKGLMAAQDAYIKEQKTQLGPAAETRIKEVGRLLETKLPQDQADAIKGALGTSALAVRALEKLLGFRDLSTPNPQPPEEKSDPFASRYPTTSK